MSSDRYIVIPTRYGRDTVVPLLETCKQVANTVVVHTEPGLLRYEGTITVDDSSSDSIQHWWNAGLDRCLGPTLVLNDDVAATADDLISMFLALETGADLVYLAGHRAGHATPLTGWCFGIHPDRIRPDNAFGWWYGDDDLYQSAIRSGMNVQALHLPIEHRRAEIAFENPVHAAMVSRDADLYQQRWG